MRISELFPTKTAVRLLDWLLEHPHSIASQNILADQLGVAPITIRRTLKRLERLELVEVDVNAADIGLNTIMFNGESEQGKAVSALSKRIAALRLENKD